MSKYYIKHWDNYKIYSDEEDEFTLDIGYADIESAISRAKICIYSQINFKHTLEETIDTFITMGQDPVIYNNETNEKIDSFNSIEYIKELYKEQNK